MPRTWLGAGPPQPGAAESRPGERSDVVQKLRRDQDRLASQSPTGRTRWNCA